MMTVQANVTTAARDFIIKSIDRQTKDVKVFKLTPVVAEKLSFKPGMFISLGFEHDGKKFGPKPYSVSSSPLAADHLEITVKKVGDFTQALFRLEEGAKVTVQGPMGKFVLDEPVPKNLVLLAAGTGIAPLLSILRYAQDSGKAGKITLFYSCKTQNCILHKDEIDHRAQKDDFTVINTLTREPEGSNWQGHSGRICEEMLKRHLHDAKNAHCYICGPAAFVKDVEQTLKDAGVPVANIKKEQWG